MTNFIPKIKNRVTFGTIVLIVCCLLIVKSCTTEMFKIYTDSQSIQSVTQMAQRENRMIEFTTSNGSKGAFNVSSKGKFELVNKNYNVSRVTVYPRNYKTEYYKDAKSGDVILPYSEDVVLN